MLPAVQAVGQGYVDDNGVTATWVSGMTGISYSAVAGSYGITAEENQAPSQSRCARDILILKRNGTYSISLAASRVLGSDGAVSTDLTGTYTLSDEGALVLTSLDWGDSMTGCVEENGSIVLAAENASERWVARKIECIWPNCRSCRGYLWHYCVRAVG